jgi:putative FmdB family regulatory protein
MPLYDYRCPQGHAFEQMATIDGRAQQPCPACGQAAAKIPSRVSLGGQASPGAGMERMPQTWRGTYEGHPEYVGQLRRQWETRQKLEDTYEELRGDRRPVLAHEGRYHDAPLRAGDPVPGAAPPGTGAPPPAPAPGLPGHSHGPPGHSHGRSGHSHGGGSGETSHVQAKDPPTTL